MRPRKLIGGRKGDVGALQRLDAHRRSHGRGTHEALGAQQDQHADGRHLLGAVEQRQTLFRLELDRFQAAALERLGRVNLRAVQLHAAEADERQCQVRQRREIARGAHRTLRRHDGVNPEAQEVEQALDEQRATAAVAVGQRVGAQQQHRANHLARQWRTHANGVADQQVALQQPRIGRQRSARARDRRSRS